MTKIGYISLSQLEALQRAGVSPEDAVNRLTTEAKARHPNAGAVVIQPALLGFGFNIMAVGNAA